MVGVGRETMRRILSILLLAVAVDAAEATVCAADIRFVNLRSSAVTIELQRFESSTEGAPAPPAELHEQFSPGSKERELYTSVSMKATIQAGADEKHLIRVGCGARVWLNWRTVGGDPVRSVSGQIALVDGEGTIRVE
jgi:hypothetical protein